VGRHFPWYVPLLLRSSRLIGLMIDTMGYALTFPFVRLIGGPSVTIGAYVHYPTVSTDMVKRVKARTAGIEDGGAAKSRLKTQIKLVYVDPRGNGLMVDTTKSLQTFTPPPSYSLRRS
jgi:hypothetical protein